MYGSRKLAFWSSFSVGIAPLVIGMFFFASIQLFFLGIVGEYVGAIHTQVLHRPLVIEKERINFPQEAPGPAGPGTGPAAAGPAAPRASDEP